MGEVDDMDELDELQDAIVYQVSEEDELPDILMIAEGRDGLNRGSNHKKLSVYQNAFNLALEIHKLTQSFPTEERYSLTDQIRRSSRSVAANIAEAWRKRRYKASFISKLSDAEGEAGETQTWIEFAGSLGYISDSKSEELTTSYDNLLNSIIGMIKYADNWTLDSKSSSSSNSSRSSKS